MMRPAVLMTFPAILAAQAPEQLFEQGRLDEARAAFHAQLAKNKNDANAMYYLGRIARSEEKSSEAVDWLEKAVKRNDMSAVYHFWLGSALGDEAQKASKFRQPFLARRVKGEFERAVQLDPRMLEPRQGLVDFYSVAPGIMGGSMDAAKAQALEIGRLSAMRGHLAMGRIANRQKDLAMVEREYRAAVAAAPDSAAGYNALANFLRNQSRWDEAFDTYDQLMKARPDEAAPHANWGITAAMSGKNLERGEREIKYWLDRAPKTTTPATFSGVRFRLGQLYAKTARPELARAEYVEAVKLNPKNQDAKKALDALK